jgi:hypothetical protein
MKVNREVGNNEMRERREMRERKFPRIFLSAKPPHLFASHIQENV